MVIRMKIAIVDDDIYRIVWLPAGSVKRLLFLTTERWFSMGHMMNLRSRMDCTGSCGMRRRSIIPDGWRGCKLALHILVVVLL